MKWEGIGGPIPSHGKRKLRLNNGCGPGIGRRQDATRTKRRSKQQQQGWSVRADLTAPQNKVGLRLLLRIIMLQLKCCKHTQPTPAHSSCHGSWPTLPVYIDGPDRSNGPEYKTVGSPDDNIKGIIEVGRQPPSPSAFLSNSLTLLPLARTVAVSQPASQPASQYQ